MPTSLKFAPVLIVVSVMSTVFLTVDPLVAVIFLFAVVVLLLGVLSHYYAEMKKAQKATWIMRLQSNARTVNCYVVRCQTRQIGLHGSIFGLESDFEGNTAYLLDIDQLSLVIMYGHQKIEVDLTGKQVKPGCLVQFYVMQSSEMLPLSGNEFVGYTDNSPLRYTITMP